MNLSNKNTYLTGTNFLFAVAIITVLVVSILLFNSGYYNNYLIFSRPFLLLQRRESLYIFHIDLYVDTFKYSPYFAFVMGLFTYLPNELGLILWNVFGISVLLLGINNYFKTEKQKKLTLLILLPAIILSAYNLQSNTLLTGLLLLSFYFFEKQQLAVAALLIALCFFIKGYGICAAILFILFSRKINFPAWLFFWICLFTVLPLFLFPFNYLLLCYKEWIHILFTVHLNYQCSVGGFFRQALAIDIPDEIWMFCGTAIFLLPFTNVSFYKNDQFRKLSISSLLIFIIIFNKMAEFPTYIIATAGMCIWICTLKRTAWVDRLLIGSVLVITILSLPVWSRIILDRWVVPYSPVVLPFLLLWLKIQYDLWKMEFDNSFVPKFSNT